MRRLTRSLPLRVSPSAPSKRKRPMPRTDTMSPSSGREEAECAGRPFTNTRSASKSLALSARERLNAAETSASSRSDAAVSLALLRRGGDALGQALRAPDADVGAAHLREAVLDVARHALKAEHIGPALREHDVAKYAPAQAEAHERAEVVPVRQLLGEFRRGGRYLEAADGRALAAEHRRAALRLGVAAVQHAGLGKVHAAELRLLAGA